jgi:hypothetical protein
MRPDQHKERQYQYECPRKPDDVFGVFKFCQVHPVRIRLPSIAATSGSHCYCIRGRYSVIFRTDRCDYYPNEHYNP